MNQEATERARSSFRSFVRQAWPIVEPEAPLIENWHVHAICDHLQALARREIRLLLINVPPGHGKSMLCSVLFPAWVWTWRPGWRSIFSSYAAPLALRDSVNSRRVIESDWFVRSFSSPDGWSLSVDENAKGLFTNTSSGSRQSTSVGGGGTGLRANFVGVDDPLNALEASSKLKRDEAIEWWDKTMSNRLNDPEHDGRLIVMQRLHEEDLSGHVIRRGGYEHLCLPSEFDPKRRSITYHVLDGERVELHRDPRGEVGELLFPQKVPQSVLDEQKRELGDGYAGQHDQLPTAAGGGMFKISDWRFWKPDGRAPDHQVSRPLGSYQGPANPKPSHFDRVIISVDATFRETLAGSFVAIHVWGASGARRLLLERVHRRMDFHETVRELLGVIGRWPEAREKVIEGKANGDAIISTLEKAHGIAGIVSENPGADGKEVRASAGLPYQRSGNVELPDGAPWLGEYIAEHAAFPRGKTNDDVDAQSQGLKHLEKPLSTMERWAKVKQ